MEKLDPDIIRERLLDACESYVNNNLPTHLIRLADMALVGRNDFWDSNRLDVAARIDLIVKDTLPVSHFHLNAWCQQQVRVLIKYAIFSHRWGSGEPHFRQLLSDGDARRVAPELHQTGHQKLLQFCEKARSEYNCAYAWSDTCCINKESSAELEEAIRSMYGWYRDAEVCIVHLAKSISFDDFPSEPWFTRGWTLQELLAPTRMKFYGKDWKPICSDDPAGNDKDSRILRQHITRVTGIPNQDLCSFRPSCDRISEKMTWMSKRKTTRVEDIAYALIGVFNVTMPIAYGEGAWAFHRLLEMISQRCWDPGFLAWTGIPSIHSAALPSSPGCYVLDASRADALQLSGFDAAPAHVTGDPSFSVIKTGMLVRLLIVPIFGLEPISPCDMYALVASRRAFPLGYSSAPVPTNTFSLRFSKSDTKFALGVVNYQLDGHRHGRLRAGTHYLALLLRRMGRSAWRKEVTDNVVVLDCRTISMKRRVETVILAHDNDVLPVIHSIADTKYHRFNLGYINFLG